jgi:hypothetical protein
METIESVRLSDKDELFYQEMCKMNVNFERMISLLEDIKRYTSRQINPS